MASIPETSEDRTAAEWRELYEGREEVWPDRFDEWVDRQEGRFEPDAPAEPEPTGPSQDDETWWLAFCREREAVLDRMLALQPVELTEADWADYNLVRLDDEQVNGYWAGLDERGDR